MKALLLLSSVLTWFWFRSFVMAPLLAPVTANHFKSVRYKLDLFWQVITPEQHTVCISLCWPWVTVCVGQWWRWLPRQSSENLFHWWPADVLQWGHLSLCPKSWSEWHLTLCRRWNRYLLCLSGLRFSIMYVCDNRLSWGGGWRLEYPVAFHSSWSYCYCILWCWLCW